MNNLNFSLRSFLAFCTLAFALSACSPSEGLPEIAEADLTVQASGECTFVVGETVHRTIGETDPEYDEDWDLMVHVEFPIHPTIEFPCGHARDEFCVFFNFEQPVSPDYRLGIRYANDQTNTIHLLTPDGNQGYVNHQAEPIPGSPNHNPATINTQQRPVKGWHKVCDESHDYYVYIDFSDYEDAPDVPLESMILESSGICVVANIGGGDDPVEDGTR